MFTPFLTEYPFLKGTLRRDQKVIFVKSPISSLEILIPTLSHEATNVDKNYSLDKSPFLGVAYTPEMRSSAEMRISKLTSGVDS